MKNIDLDLLRLANGISHQLIAAAQKAQPEWIALSQDFPDDFRWLIESSRIPIPIYGHSLFAQFVGLWALNMEWPTVNAFADGLEIQVPDLLLAPLIRSGKVESFSFFLADRAALCSATLGNNDHNQEYGLFLNCAAWLQLGALPEYFDCFARQLRMVIHHEMAHIRYKHGDLRIEQIAHCRGIASLLPWETFPDSAEVLLQAFKKSFPEVLANAEIRDLFELCPAAAWRLTRRWSYMNAKALQINVPS